MRPSIEPKQHHLRTIVKAFLFLEFSSGLREFQDCADDLCEGKCTPGATKILNEMINLTKESVTVACPASVMAECPEKDGEGGSSMAAFNGVYLALSMVVCLMFR